MQKIIGVTDLQRRFRAVLDEVVGQQVPYVLTRGSRPEAALVPYEDYLRFQELEERGRPPALRPLPGAAGPTKRRGLGRGGGSGRRPGAVRAGLRPVRMIARVARSSGQERPRLRR
jgi:prevent-host-death family protein